MKDIARAAGVSKNAVSLALRNDPQISLVTRERIQALAAEMGYRRNPTVDHLMAHLRAGAASGHRATLALLNANEDRLAFKRHPTIPHFVEGCRRQAVFSGYSLDEFWLHDLELDGEKLNRILKARGIRGGVIVGLMTHNRLPERFEPTWEAFPWVVAGVRTREPALPFASSDQYIVASQGLENAVRLGYQRPAIVLERSIDQLVDGRFSAGFWYAQQSLAKSRRIAPFYYNGEGCGGAPFERWFRETRPDVILTRDFFVARWLDRLKVKVPEEVGLIQLEWREERPEWAGMLQNNDLVGEAAVEMAVAMIHRGRSLEMKPRATFIDCVWKMGATVWGRAERRRFLKG